MFDTYETLTYINDTCKAAMNKYIHVSKIRHCNMCKSYTTEILNTLGICIQFLPTLVHAKLV